MVKMVEAELKMEVSEDMRAANITANIRPLMPTGILSLTSMMKATLVHPPSELQILLQSSEMTLENDTITNLSKNKKFYLAWRIPLGWGRGPSRPSRGTP